MVVYCRTYALTKSTICVFYISGENLRCDCAERSAPWGIANQSRLFMVDKRTRVQTLLGAMATGQTGACPQIGALILPQLVIQIAYSAL